MKKMHHDQIDAAKKRRRSDPERMDPAFSKNKQGCRYENQAGEEKADPCNAQKISQHEQHGGQCAVKKCSCPKVRRRALILRPPYKHDQRGYKHACRCHAGHKSFIRAIGLLRDDGKPQEGACNDEDKSGPSVFIHKTPLLCLQPCGLLTARPFTGHFLNCLLYSSMAGMVLSSFSENSFACWPLRKAGAKPAL